MKAQVDKARLAFTPLWCHLWSFLPLSSHSKHPANFIGSAYVISAEVIGCRFPLNQVRRVWKTDYSTINSKHEFSSYASLARNLQLDDEQQSQHQYYQRCYSIVMNSITTFYKTVTSFLTTLAHNIVLPKLCETIADWHTKWSLNNINRLTSAHPPQGSHYFLDNGLHQFVLLLTCV